eukprot:1888573-Rhodomonas_salina.2
MLQPDRERRDLHGDGRARVPAPERSVEHGRVCKNENQRVTHSERKPDKREGPKKASCMVVTAPVFQVDMSPLNA